MRFDGCYAAGSQHPSQNRGMTAFIHRFSSCSLWCRKCEALPRKTLALWFYLYLTLCHDGGSMRTQKLRDYIRGGERRVEIKLRKIMFCLSTNLFRFGATLRPSSPTAQILTAKDLQHRNDILYDDRHRLESMEECIQN